ncbi:Ankyrin-3 [Pseudocercospora fuligena]|uniref:Ankyrin-3 n=1 Tax=Pseudocercospora fuligena TaxID=685502 RepID=A0A8H6RWE7_9PEZI|nr:Ankyrin-3 [Pseudocercospora fuligena]
MCTDEVLSGNDRNRTLLEAAAEGQNNRVRYLIHLGADLDHSDQHGLTALHHAAFCGFEDVVATLLVAGADVNALSPDCGTPLHLAAIKGRLNVCETFCLYLADVKATSKLLGTPIHCACFHDNLSLVNLLLRRVRQQEGPVVTTGIVSDALAYHLRGGTRRIQDVLAEFNTWAARGYCPTLRECPLTTIAVGWSNVEILTVILDAFPYLVNSIYFVIWPQSLAEIDFSNPKGKISMATDLHLAVEHARFDVVSLLLARQAQANTRDSHNDTPLHVAVRDHHGARKRIVEALLTHGADLTLQDRDGHTAAEACALSGSQAILRLLLARGSPKTELIRSRTV